MRCTFKNSVSIKAGAARVETTANITSDGVVLSPYEDTDDGDIKKITRKNGNILIRITNNKKNDVQGYDNVNFTVKYKDDGYGWFFLRYIEKNGNSGKETEIINLTNTGEEKTHTFVLSDVAFLVQGIQDNSVSPSKFYDFETLYLKNLDMADRTIIRCACMVKRNGYRVGNIGDNGRKRIAE